MTNTVNPLGKNVVQHLPLRNLHLDTCNPRLGALSKVVEDERVLLNTIVNRFGIEDVLSSIAVNGFFESEPLVGVGIGGDEVRILEGNRRLAACLILTNDPRAADQSKRSTVFQGIMASHGTVLGDLPVLVYDEEEDKDQLLPFLGVRHIAGAQPWDSYAKAAWIAQVLEEGKLGVDEISQMVGDEHRTVSRIVHGYYLVRQLVDEGLFNPEESVRPGKGSNPEFPFSWVYTALGYQSIREWLGIGDIAAPEKSPVPKSHLDRGEKLMRFLFGHKSSGLSAAVRESREISLLARAVADAERRRYLDSGKTVREIEALSRPGHERLTDALFSAKEGLEMVYALLGQGDFRRDELPSLQRVSDQVVHLAGNVRSKLEELSLQ